MGSQPHWYQDAVIYQSHVKTFLDSTGDGIGDFRGFTQKLDYLQHLGVTAVWILPFYPSPLRDDGYDIADYTSVHPRYGTLADFKSFLRAAHERGLRVITELVLNHTSDKHPWFQRARQAKPGSRWRDFYVWSDSPDRYRDARIIFQDFEASNWTWDPVASAYFWHRFYHHQPDLNFDNPEVCRTMLKLVEYWLDLGVDGLRLDAVPYLFEREETNCENLPETHAFLKQVRAHIDARFPDRMVLAEANQWPEDAVAYFGDGDECHAAFHFPVMPRLFMAVQMEDRFPIIDILENTPAIPANCQWFLFLRNHDELTLEMVTDEERDYMYRMYARDPQARINLGIRRRLAPLLGNNRRKIELLNGILMALPGTPVIYYGDEIGMGDNIYLGDRDGVRTPMQWSADRNAGFSTANPQQLYLPTVIDQEYHYQAINVETQNNNPHSLLWWMRRLIARRQELGVFGRGDLKFLYADNPKVLAFTRTSGSRTVLVVANLSRHSQYVELDLAAHRGAMPVEVFGETNFPPIGELPYLLTLGPYAFYWFVIDAPVGAGQAAAGDEPVASELPVLTIAGEWRQVFHGAARDRLELALASYLEQRRAGNGPRRTIEEALLLDVVPLGETAPAAAGSLALVQVKYTEGEAETCTIVLGFLADDMHVACPLKAVCRLRSGGAKGREQFGWLIETTTEADVGRTLADCVASRRRLRGEAGRIAGHTTRAFRRDGERTGHDAPPTIAGDDHANTSFVFADRFVFKAFSRVEAGANPAVDVPRFLTESAGFAHTPPLLGWLEYQREGQPGWALGLLQGYIRHEGDGWTHALGVLSRYFERLLTEFCHAQPPADPLAAHAMFDLAQAPLPALAEDFCGPYLSAAELLGRRLAEMHLALASSAAQPEFAPEPFSQLYQRSLFQAFRTKTIRTVRLLRRKLSDVPASAAADAEAVVAAQEAILQRFRALTKQKLPAQRLRCHGDFHLGQVLYTGRDFAIIDFVGDASRPLGERRIKRSPLRDVAGILRSLHHAAFHAAAHQLPASATPCMDVPAMQAWASYWASFSGAALLRSYLATAANAPFLPPRGEDVGLLLDVFLLDQAIQELNQSLTNASDRLPVPLRGIRQLLRADSNE